MADNPAQRSPARRPTADELASAVRRGDRAILSRAITLVESTRPADRALAAAVVEAILPATGNAIRVGITGVPGVGKSSFIETLGRRLTAEGHKVAVLAVDPSSTRTGGSILGDKTRMAALSADPNAYIRPSPTAGQLGGVARMTRETMLLCEAAGYDVVLVETVGVGQSEILVASMVDMFMALMLPGGGDELQGIKKGLIEVADLIAVNKADGPNRLLAEQARRHYANALHIIEPASPNWNPPVLCISALTGEGLDELWQTVREHRAVMTASGEFDTKRRRQRRDWLWSMLDDRLLAAFREHERVAAILPALEEDVASGQTSPSLAVGRLLRLFGLGAGADQDAADAG